MASAGAQVAEAACAEYLPLATGMLPPTIAAVLAPLDVLVCKGAEAAIVAAITAAGPLTAPVVGGSVVLAHVPVTVGGKPVALLRAPAAWVAKVQAAMAGGAR